MQEKVQGHFSAPPGSNGSFATLDVQVMASGYVWLTTTVRSGGAQAYEPAARAAVERATPFPMPEQGALQEQMGLVTLEFEGSSVRIVKAVAFRDRTSRLECNVVPPPKVLCPEQVDKRALVNCYAAGVVQQVGSVLSACASAAYPPEAREKLWEGKATVELLFGKQGVVRGTRVAESSGHEVLDQRAIELVESVNLTPPAPMLNSHFILRVPVMFKLKEAAWFKYWPRGCPPDASDTACPKSLPGPSGTSRR